MASYKELLKQRESLELQIAEARKKELAQAIAQAKALVAEFGLSAQDIFPSGRGAAKRGGGAKVAAKYRNPATGDTWTGRGKAPKWIAGQDRQKFAIAAK
jgi:DNA-binding protein H-NS